MNISKNEPRIPLIAGSAISPQYMDSNAKGTETLRPEMNLAAYQTSMLFPVARSVQLNSDGITVDNNTVFLPHLQDNKC